MEILLAPVFFILLSWFLFILAGGDLSRIFHWAKHLYRYMFPLSCLMCVLESAQTGRAPRMEPDLVQPVCEPG